MSECGAELAACMCTKPAGHVEQGDAEHACGEATGMPLPCQGRWKGEPGTPELTVLALPFPPPPAMYLAYGVTTEAELLEIASEELRTPQPPPLRVKRGGIRYNTPEEKS
jgi:hypothetical protein